MATIRFTSALKRFFPQLQETKVEAADIRQALAQIESKYTGITGYLVDDNGNLRQHVNIFLKGELIKDRQNLSDTVQPHDEIVIFQALSGG